MTDKYDYSPLTFTAMKKYIQKIKDSINKSWNNKTSKTKRLIIYGLLPTRCLWWRCTRRAVADTRPSPWRVRTS